MGFGDPNKYVLLKYDSREIAQLDDAIKKGTLIYLDHNYSSFRNNCHSFVANVLIFWNIKERVIILWLMYGGCVHIMENLLIGKDSLCHILDFSFFY